MSFQFDLNLANFNKLLVLCKCTCNHCNCNRLCSNNLL